MQPKLFLLSLFLLANVVLHAQLQKGTRMTGGSIASGLFTSGNTDYTYPTGQAFSTNNKNFSIAVTPYYGVFVSNNVVIGASLNLAASSQRTDYKTLRDTIYSSSKLSNTDVGIGA